jgi:hypothetical protein
MPVLSPIALQGIDMADDLIPNPLTLWRIMRWETRHERTIFHG